MLHSQLLQPLIRKLRLRAPLDESDVRAILALGFRLHEVPPSAYLVREGEPPQRCCLLISGFACRHKVTDDGLRQIVSVHVPSDFVDLEGALLNVADHNVQALTRCEFAIVPRAQMQALILSHPRVAAALWVDTLIDASIFREWVANVGRRDARGRVAHLLCELARRLEVTGLIREKAYELPMTQEQLGDATGLTPVHVNRVLRLLEEEGLIERHKRFVRITDWAALCNAAGFVETYLHLDQVAPVRQAA